MWNRQARRIRREMGRLDDVEVECPRAPACVTHTPVLILDELQILEHVLELFRRADHDDRVHVIRLRRLPLLEKWRRLINTGHGEHIVRNSDLLHRATDVYMGMIEIRTEGNDDLVRVRFDRPPPFHRHGYVLELVRNWRVGFVNSHGDSIHRALRQPCDHSVRESFNEVGMLAFDDRHNLVRDVGVGDRLCHVVALHRVGRLEPQIDVNHKILRLYFFMVEHTMRSLGAQARQRNPVTHVGLLSLPHGCSAPSSSLPHCERARPTRPCLRGVRR